MNIRAEHAGRLIAVAVLALSSCQSLSRPAVIIIDGGQMRFVNAQTLVPRALLSEAGLNLGAADQVLINGYPVNPDAALSPGDRLVLQIRRALEITINGKEGQTAALTVGDAISERGVALYAADALDPPAETPIKAGMAITYVASRPLIVVVDGRQLAGRSAAPTTGAALADARIGLVGLDVSNPAEQQPLPANGRVEVTRVSEALILAETGIPYKTNYQESPAVELGQEQILQQGVTGLALTRTRIRYANGVEVSRSQEAETVVRPPQDRLVARGSKIVSKAATVDGVTIQYWRMLQMYATVYSPCNSGTGGCSYGTASGLRAGKGVVAVDPALFSYLSGQRLYIPGYGFAVIGDIGGGYIVERNLGISRYKWIDLGFDDSDLHDMTGWITVYFLSPAPAGIPDALK